MTPNVVPTIALSLAAASGFVFAQDPSPASTGGWRRLGDPPPASQQNQAPATDPQSYGVAPQLTIKPGTFVTVRVNQVLSSDRNQAGDAFAATLVRPIVVDGVVVEPA